jgi:hypothetical protein
MSVNTNIINGVPRETFPGETRVALVPVVVATLVKAGVRVVVEREAGDAAGYADAAPSSRREPCSPRATTCSHARVL